METPEPASSPSWQFEWKRPRLATPVANVMQRNYEQQLRGSVPIQCKAARLTTAEARSIVKKLEAKNVVGEHSTKRTGIESHNDMEWEDIDKAFDEDHGIGTNRMESACNEQSVKNEDFYVLSVTIFASEASVKLLRNLQENNIVMKGRVDELLPADIVLMQVIKDSSTIKDSKYDEFSCLDRDQNDTVDVVMSKLMQWPASALIDLDATTNSFIHQEAFKDTLQNISRTFHLVKSQPQHLDGGTNYKMTKTLEHQAKLIRRRIGVKSFALSRRYNSESNKHNDLDADDLLELLDRMALHTLPKNNRLFETTRAISNLENSSSSNNANMSHESELLLSCLANDGHVHIFNALDVLSMNDITEYKSQKTTLSRLIREKDIGNSFFNEFESLVFGETLQNKLKETVLPLSNPKATVPLSVASGKQNDAIQSESVSVSNDTSKRFEKTATLFYQDGFSQSLLDLSFLNSNIETSTIQFRTVRNVPSICVAAFDYVVISGNGDKVMNNTKMTNYSSLDTSSNERTKYTSEGGFISFISLHNLSETRTIFLPFAPNALSPIIWNEMQLILVNGSKKNESLAIRIDASGMVTFDSNSEASSLSNKYNKYGRSEAKQMVNKFCSFDFLLNSYDRYVHNGPNMIRYPLSNTSIGMMPCMVFYNYDGCNASLSLHRMIGLTQDMNHDYDYSGLIKASIVCSHDPIRDVQIPLTVDENEICQCCGSGNGWTMISFSCNSFCNTFFIVWEGKPYYENIYSVCDNNNFCQVSEIIPVTEITPQEPGNNSILQYDSLSLISEALEEIRGGCYGTKKVADILLNKCKNWNDVNRQRDYIDYQIAVASIQYSINQCFLTLRKTVASGKESSIHDVVYWLCAREQFYTAVQLLLTLSGDGITLANLTGFDNYSTDILDGIQPLNRILAHSSRFPPSGEYSSVVKPLHATKDNEVTNLADMTVACFVKGGLQMSQALHGFLRRNPYFDTFRACLLLGGMSTLSLRTDSLNSFSDSPMDSEMFVFWPIQCLLTVAVSRKCIPAALLILNAAIPKAMQNCLVNEGSSRSMAICKSIIKMIIESSEDSLGVLLNLIQNENETYWSSISSTTKFELSTLQIRGKYPLLLEMEVRQWALGLFITFTNNDCHDSITEVDDIPINWLQTLCLACLQNSACDISVFDLYITHKLERDDDLFSHFKNEEIVVSKILETEKDGIDYDLLLPSLLLLLQKGVNWLDNFGISTQSMLNIVSKMAGKAKQKNEYIYAFNSNVVTRQCALMGNMTATANLIGGNDGIVIHCASVITSGKTDLVKQAEAYLIGKTDEIPFSREMQIDTGKKQFTITNSHREILWYLTKYALNADRIGHRVCLISVNNVDPIFAAKICFRAWLALCIDQDKKSSGMWLEKWLKTAIHDNDKDMGRATIYQTLLWTDETNEVTLGESLGLSNSFLVKLGLAFPATNVNLM